MRTLAGGSISTPMDHAPVALTFSSEPLEIEMNKEAEAEVRLPHIDSFNHLLDA